MDSKFAHQIYSQLNNNGNGFALTELEDALVVAEIAAAGLQTTFAQGSAVLTAGRLLESAIRMDRLAKPKTGESPEARAAGQRVRTAADQMSQAAEALGDGRSDDAGTSGSLAAAGVQSAADLLERALRPGPERTDVSAEEAPAQFEEQIAEYFRRLTRAQ